MSSNCAYCGGEVRLSLSGWYCRDCSRSWGLLSDGVES